MCWQCWMGTTALWVSRAFSIGLRMLTSQLAALPIELGGPSKNVLSIQNIQEFVKEYYLVPHEFLNIRSRPFHLDHILSLIRPQEQCWNTCGTFIRASRQNLKQKHFAYCHFPPGYHLEIILTIKEHSIRCGSGRNNLTISCPTPGQLNNQSSYHRAV